MKTIHGFIRSVPGGTPQVGATVTLRHADGTDAAVAVGGLRNLSANPVTTGADGSFTFTMDLSPGPVYVEAVAGSETKIRDGSEVMQAGDDFLSDLPDLHQVYTDGVLVGQLDECVVSAGAGTREVDLATGKLLIAGHIWSIGTAKTLTADTETVLAERWDVLVAEQTISGTQSGQQNLTLVKGTLNQTEPTLNTDPAVKQFPLARVVVANGASAVVIADKRVYASVHLNPGQITGDLLAADSVTATVIAADAVGTGELGDGVVTYPKLAPAAIGSGVSQVAPGVHTHPSTAITDFGEATQDQIGAHVKAGMNVSVSYNDTTGDTTITATGSLGITIQEGDVTRVTNATTADFDDAAFNVSESPTGEANIGLAYGNSAGTPAEGSHTHSTFQNFDVQAFRDVATSGAFTVTSTTGQTVLSDTQVLSNGVTYDLFVWGQAELSAPSGQWIWAAIDVSGSGVSWVPIWLGNGTEGGERGVMPFAVVRAIVGAGQTITVSLKAKVGAGSGSISTASLMGAFIARGSGGVI